MSTPKTEANKKWWAKRKAKHDLTCQENEKLKKQIHELQKRLAGSIPLDSLKDSLLLLRQTNEKQQVLFLKLQQTLVEIQQLRAENATFLRAIRLTLELPAEDQHHIAAVMKDTRVAVSHAYDKGEMK